MTEVKTAVTNMNLTNYSSVRNLMCYFHADSSRIIMWGMCNIILVVLTMPYCDTSLGLLSGTTVRNYSYRIGESGKPSRKELLIILQT